MGRFPRLLCRSPAGIRDARRNEFFRSLFSLALPFHDEKSRLVSRVATKAPRQGLPVLSEMGVGAGCEHILTMREPGNRLSKLWEV